MDYHHKLGEKRKKDNFDQHVIFTDDELLKKIKLSKNINTEKSERKAHRAFTRFLGQLGCHDLEYWNFEEPELDNYLAKFWLSAHKTNDEEDSDDAGEDKEKLGQLYSANSLRNFRYALNRILKEKGHLYNITTKGTSFHKSDEAFKVALKQLKEEGKTQVHSHPEICEEGKPKFYLSPPNKNSASP